MVNKKFEVYKLSRELKRSGVEYEFKRAKKNDFGEPEDDEEDDVGIIKGIYHEQNGHVQVTVGDTTQVRTKKVPNILCLYEDIAPLKLQTGDRVSFGGKVYEVTGVVDIQNWNIIADISLEVVDNGIQAGV